MDYSKLLRIFSDKLTEANEIYVNEKLKELGFDRTKRGRVVSVNGTICIVEIDGEEYNCKLRRGLYVEQNDIVFVKFPQDSSVDKYVDAVLGGNETPEGMVISAQEILDKLKTVDGAGSGLDADFLDGKHANEFATLDDLEGIDVDISGESIVVNINTSQSIIDDKNLSENVNDAIDKKHSHANKSIIDNINQDDVDTWDTVINKSDKTYVDNKLGDKVDRVEGKGLSEESFSTSEKSKLAGISNNANKVESSLTNGNIKIDGAEKNVYTHPSGTNPHGTTKSDVGLGKVEDKSSATIRGEITSSNIAGALGYTPENNLNKGVANGYAPLDSNTKIPLSILPDIAKQQTYVVTTIADRDALSSLIMGEKCYVTDTGDSYIWDGDSWEILAKADWENVNLQWTNILGKPSSNVADIDDAVSVRHTHSNKSIIDTITQTLINRWNSAWEHISDTIKHVTSAERTKWNTVDSKADTTYVNSELSKKTNIGHAHTESDITNLDKYTKAETDTKLSGKIDKATGKQLSTEDFTAIYKNKLDGIESGANKYILPIATETILGGIKVGANLSISENGILSAVDNEDRSSLIIKQEIFVANEGQQVFNLTTGHYQPNTNTISVYLYGGKQPNIILNEISSSSLEITEPLKAGDVVIVEYFELSSATPYPMHGSDHLSDGYDPIPLATISKEGLMSKGDKSKLDGVESGANKYTHPNTHSLSMITETTDRKILTASERNKIAEIDSKVDKISGKGLSDENYTLTEKNKLAGIAIGATKNDTDANLKNRANHTGTQPSSTISDFASTVRNTVLTGLSTATNAAITATDTVLSALGKLQKQISDNLSTLTNHIANKSNPHGTTKSHIGLGNVDNTADSTKNVLSATKLTTARTINEVSFDGASNIIIEDSTKEPKFTKNTAFNKNFGTTAGTVVQGNDSRLSDARTPLAHNHPKSEITGLPTKLSEFSKDINFDERYYTESEMDTKLATKSDTNHNHDTQYEPKNPNIQSHISNTSNPHSTTKSHVGLGSVLNYGLSTQPEAEAGTSNVKYMTPLRTKQAIDKQVADKNYVTQDELGDAGFGDMVKAVYDTNNNGIVDNAEKLGGQLPSYYQQALGYTPVNKAGDTMTGPLRISGSILSSEFASDNWSFINHYMSGGWARGIVNVKDNANALQMQIGLHGSGQTLNRMYFGKAYSDFAMEIFPATKKTNFVGTLTKDGKPIATEEYVDNKKTIYIGASPPANSQVGWIDTTL